MNNECFDLVREREPERERDRERDPVREPERARESQRKPQREPQRATEILSASSWHSLTLWFSLAPLALSGSLCLSLALSDSLRLSLSLRICSQSPCLAHKEYFLSTVQFDDFFRGGRKIGRWCPTKIWSTYIFFNFPV